MTRLDHAHPPTLLVNVYTRVIHRPESKHAATGIPRGVYQTLAGDRACGVCKPDLDSEGDDQ